jgi:hypothetical protein
MVASSLCRGQKKRTMLRHGHQDEDRETYLPGDRRQNEISLDEVERIAI